MSRKEQLKLRLILINSIISVYQSMPHQIGISNKDIHDTLEALTIWKEETEILLSNETD